MARQYPYESDRKKIKNFTCETCHLPKEEGFQLEWQMGWSRGDDEYEKICKDCLKTREEENKAKQEAYVKRMTPIWNERARKEQAFWDKMKQRLEAKYEVKYLTEHQWRINGKIDVYPTNRRYHILKTGQRGGYNDMHGFLADHLR